MGLVWRRNNWCIYNDKIGIDNSNDQEWHGQALKINLSVYKHHSEHNAFLFRLFYS